MITSRWPGPCDARIVCVVYESYSYSPRYVTSPRAPWKRRRALAVLDVIADRAVPARHHLVAVLAFTGVVVRTVASRPVGVPMFLARLREQEHVVAAAGRRNPSCSRRRPQIAYRPCVPASAAADKAFNIALFGTAGRVRATQASTSASSPATGGTFTPPPTVRPRTPAWTGCSAPTATSCAPAPAAAGGSAPVSFSEVRDPRRVAGGAIGEVASRLVDARQQAADAMARTDALKELLVIVARTAHGRGETDAPIRTLLADAGRESERALARLAPNAARSVPRRAGGAVLARASGL